MTRKIVIVIALMLMLLSFAALVALAQDGNEPVPEPVNVQQAAPGAILAGMGTAFTYQGSLVDDSNPANGVYDFQFSLFDAVSVGSQIGVTQTIDNIGVSDGLFTVSLDFGTDAFNGQARWLEIAVKRDADGSYTTLTPRVALTPAPHALALPGLWTQQNVTSPNLIGGYAGNVMGTGVTGGTISGGGLNDGTNRVYDIFGTVGGGYDNVAGIDDGLYQDVATVGGGAGNRAIAPLATVGGGQQNTASGLVATVSGGFSNTANADWSSVGGGQNNAAIDESATVGGGHNNTASAYAAIVSGGENNLASGSGATVGGGGGNTANKYFATVGGGVTNIASGESATVGGGWKNLAAADYATISGGGPSDGFLPNTTNNRVYDNYGTVGGGGGNVVGIDDGIPGNQTFSTISGGRNNNVSHIYATVSGGANNQSSNYYSTVGGGVVNSASGNSATTGGGYSNDASGSYSTVPGGRDNTAAGDYSFAAGRRSIANHDGVFIWADSTDADFASTAADTFNVRAGNGVRIETNTNSNGMQVINNGADGAGFYVENSGSGKDDATLRANNTQISGGVTAYLTNSSNYSTMHAYNGSNGEVLYLQNGGDSAGSGGGDFIKAVDESQSDAQFRVTTTGEVRSDVGFNTPAADFAEMLPAVAGLELGDVLAIGLDGQLVRTSAAYQPTVVGVYSTQPGFVGGMPMEGTAEGMVPLSVVGVVPVKASAEGGMIQPGDMLTASATPGHAMKAKPDAPQGTVIGKALEPLSEDTGVILMLVILQ